MELDRAGVEPLPHLVVQATRLEVAVQRRVVPAEDAHLATVERARLVVVAADPHADVQAEDAREADVQEHVATRHRDVLAVRRADDVGVGDLVADHQLSRRLPAAARHRIARRLGRQLAHDLVDVPALLRRVVTLGVEVQRAVGECGEHRARTPISRSAHRRAIVVRRVIDLHTPREDRQRPVAVPLGERDDALEHRRPHVQLHLLGEAQVRVQEVRQPVAAARPRLDRELQRSVAAASAELDLTGLEMARQRREAKRCRRPVDDAHRSVPRPRHPHDVLVADAHLALVALQLLKRRELRRRDRVEVARDARDQLVRRQGRGADPHPIQPMHERADAIVGGLQVLDVGPDGQLRHVVLGPRARPLPAIDRRQAPQVAPRRQCDADRPAGGRAHALQSWLTAGHVPPRTQHAPRSSEFRGGALRAAVEVRAAGDGVRPLLPPRLRRRRPPRRTERWTADRARRAGAPLISARNGAPCPHAYEAAVPRGSA